MLIAVAIAAVVLGAAGAATLAVERRLDTLAPGGVAVAALHYNALTGDLRLAGVRARAADGREIFQADHISAHASPLPLLAGILVLSRVRVEAPRLTVTSGDELTVAPALRVEDAIVTGGRVVVGQAAHGRPLRADDVDLRLSDRAFACEFVVSGTHVRVTGQPRRPGYGLHVRAHDLDLARVARELPGWPLAGVRAGRGDVDAELWLGQGRLLAAGRARVEDFVLALPVRGEPRLRAASVTVVADGLDLLSGAGRIARVVIGQPSLSLPITTAAPTLAALLDRLRLPDGLRVRRITVTDGTLALTGSGGVRLRHVQMAAGAPERAATDGWAVTARAALDGGADVALDGVLARDFRALDAATRVRRAGLAPWRGLTGAAIDWDARVSFEGRLRVAAQEGAMTLTGQTALADDALADRVHVDVHRSVASAEPGRMIRELLVALEDAIHTASRRD